METKFGFTKGDVVIYTDYKQVPLIGVVSGFQEEFKNILIYEDWHGQDINTCKSGSIYGMRAYSPTIVNTHINLYNFSPEKQMELFEGLKLDLKNISKI